ERRQLLHGAVVLHRVADGLLEYGTRHRTGRAAELDPADKRDVVPAAAVVGAPGPVPAAALPGGVRHIGAACGAGAMGPGASVSPRERAVPRSINRRPQVVAVREKVAHSPGERSARASRSKLNFRNASEIVSRSAARCVILCYTRCQAEPPM